jgi:hypothetical protein
MKDVDGRNKSGHDERRFIFKQPDDKQSERIALTSGVAPHRANIYRVAATAIV